MRCLKITNGVIIKNINSGINFENTLECGQCFRWEKKEDKYYATVRNEHVAVYRNGPDIILENTTVESTKNFWTNYFDLNFDYGKVQKKLENIHPIFKKAYQNYPGIHILNQDPWETLCSFIISQNNNIPRIKKIISSLCITFGEKINNTESYMFPGSEIINRLSEKDLDPIKCGFRAKYILDAATKVSSGEIDLENLKNININKAKEILMKIKGVGPKISECVLLYAYHKLECFPMDVWIKKIMRTIFKGKKLDVFGKYPGIAQQYLYHYVRNKVKIF
jgi:N-glycosylase/DNA lyase